MPIAQIQHKSIGAKKSINRSIIRITQVSIRLQAAPQAARGLTFVVVCCLLLGAVATQLFVQPSVAQDVQRFGVFGNYTWNQHVANFSVVPGDNILAGKDSSLPAFRGGTGQGWTVGVLYEFPVEERLRLMLRGVYSQHDGSLSRLTPYVFSGRSGQVISGELETAVAARFRSVSIEPLLSWQPSRRVPFTLLLGGRVGYMTESLFDQNERPIEVTGTVIIRDGLALFQNAPITNPQTLQAAVIAGMSYEIPFLLSSSVFNNAQSALILAPEVLASYGLTGFSTDASWLAHSLRVGLSVKYLPSVPSNLSIASSFRTAPTDALSTDISAIGFNAEGKELPLIKLTVEEFRSQRAYALLPYIFFDAASAVLPERYARLYDTETKQFAEQSLVGREALEVYYHLLNIIGRRMTDNPASTLKITGCVSESPANKNGEGADATLAKRRAESVASYLRDIWGIAAERLLVQARGLPQKPSASKDVAANVEENRRVELSSDDATLFKPVVLQDTLREVTPPVVRFRVNAEAKAGIAKWNIKISQGKTLVKQYLGTGEPDEFYLWNLAADRSVPRAEGVMKFGLEVTDTQEHAAEALGSIPVEQLTLAKKASKDKRIDLTRLLHLDPERPELMPEQTRMLDELVRPLVKRESDVLITGYTDATGDVKASQKLAEARSQAAYKHLNSGTGAAALPTAFVKSRAAQMKSAPFPNNLPEGRFYNRSVEIRVETPLQ